MGGRGSSSGGGGGGGGGPAGGAPFGGLGDGTRPAANYANDNVSADAMTLAVELGLGDGSAAALRRSIGVGDLPGALVANKFRDSLHISFLGQDANMQRKYYLNDAGHKVAYNESLDVFRTGTGLGTKIFANQVDQLSAAGFRTIDVTAAGTPDSRGMNGFYTWAALGYYAKLRPSKAAEFRRAFPGAGAGEVTTHLVMQTPGGRQWWKANGNPFTGTFDLAKGSQARKILNDYVAEKSTR
jgi:hypothetical protein